MIEGVLRQAIPILVNTQGEFSPADFAAAFNRILHKPLDQKALDVFPITAEEYVNPPEGPPTSPYLICSPEPGTAAPEGTSETSLMVLGAGLFQPSGEIMAGETLSVMFGEDVTGAYIYSNFLIPLPLEGATVVTGLQGAYVLVTCSEFGQDTVDDGCGAIFTYAFDGGATSCLTFYTQP
jgi:hypothetical protein